MEHELKIIYTFDPDGGNISTTRVKILIDNEQLGLVQNISFIADANGHYPEIEINLVDNSLFPQLSKNIQNTILKTYDSFKDFKIIKSNILNGLEKYITLKAFW